MNYELIEQQICSRLQPFAIVGVDVIVMPELEADRKRPVPTKAQFTVIYSCSEYGNVNSTAQINQNEDLYFTVLIESTFLRGAMGVYSLLNTLRKAIVGFKPTGCLRIQAVKHHTIGSPDAQKIDNMWQDQAVFKTSTLLVEDYTEDVTALVTRIKFIDQPDGETMIVPPTE